MKPILKLIIAIMLILCLADMPYGFYELVRFAAAGAFVYLSYDYFKNKRDDAAQNDNGIHFFCFSHFSKLHSEGSFGISLT